MRTALAAQPPLSACTICTPVGRPQRMREIEDLLAVDEEAHVRAHAVLLVDHAEAQAGITAGRDRPAARPASRRAASTSRRAGVGAQRRWGSAPSSAHATQQPRSPPRRSPAGAGRCSFQRVAFVAAHPELAAGRAEIEPDGIAARPRVIAWRFTVHHAWLFGRPASRRCQLLPPLRVT